MMAPEDQKRKRRSELDAKDRQWVRVESPEVPAKERSSTFCEVCQVYPKDLAIEEAGRCLGCKKPICMKGCPIKQDVQGYVKAIQSGDFDKALEIIMDRNPLPESVGRVCPQFCAAGCLRGKKGDPICVAALKRAAGEYGNFQPRVDPPTGKRIAVVGAGPGGLAAAYFLTKWGHKVTIYERENVKGGMLYTAIPEYRLPKEAVRRDVERIERMGVEFKLGVKVGTDIDLKKLGDDHDAVILAIGTHLPKFMDVPGKDKKGVVHVVPMLRDINLGKKVWIGDKVTVIGGGSSALDVARAVKRLGKDPIILYRRTKEFMPAPQEEVRETEEEGVRFEFLVAPTKILGDESVKRLEMLRMRLGEPDKSGRARPVPIEGSEFHVDADMVIEAINQEPDLTGLDGGMFKLTRWNTFDVDGNGMTSQKGVYAAGDCVIGSSTVVQAIASAIKAAIGIHRQLTGNIPPGFEEGKGEGPVPDA